MTLPNGTQKRAAPLRASTWNAEELTFDIILSTGAAVERGGFTEILDLSGATWPETIPLLDSHRSGSLDDNIGDVTNIRLEGAEIIGTAKLSKHSEKAKRIAAELSESRKFAASIGYDVGQWSEATTGGKRTLTARKFHILECSLVSVPADAAAGIRSKPTTPEGPKMTRAEINAEIRSIAKATNLDAAWIDTQIDAEATVDAARAAAIDAMKTRSTTAPSNIQIGTDHTDPESIRSAMADALAHRIAPATRKLEGRAVEYRGHSVLDLVGDMATSRGERVNLRDRDALLQRAVGAHSTSDFPLLLADAANKALLSQYEVAAPSYRQWCARKPFTDFKETSFLRAGDVPAFKEINESGEVTYGTISESAEKVTAKEYGTGIAIGRRALINDDLSALSDFSSGIAIRAANDENRMAYQVLATNAALSDTKALFHTDHANLAGSGTAIDATSIGAAVAALRAQKSLDGMVLNLQPAFLVVGPTYETAARQILASINATKASEVNVWSGFATLVVDANISGNAWYLFASPTVAPTVVFGYVGGAEGPQVRSERDFDTQAVKVAASLDFAVGAIDFRGGYKNAGA
ncbi:Mu-like prophage major head subunit gpT family protein [Hoeflea sp. G2-23]|uniref:Mu-like prophage major head subunit gpT family protein n=1 Tax=Hoeflea algicola TaxID=2983763 RepID=A0ABT3ZDI0_9HYPH|nr:prohead protease/major capsid protein fusion protein [Hoeflea algicola]MCY0149857.1 Mu-like prophage major head subunit gpT family protein [Hoeflea algicola]